MRILVTYDSHSEVITRTAKQVGELLRRAGNELDMVDLAVKEIDILAPYDKIVVGGELRFGKLSHALQKYMLKNRAELVLKPSYIFIHAYVGDPEFQLQVSRAIPVEILNQSFTFNLGMDIDVDSLNPLEKIRWKLQNQHVDTPADPKLVSDFAEFVLRPVE